MAKNNNESRLEKELLLLRRNGFMGIGELAEQCDVSEMTVRRDLRRLAKENKVRMVYGGATSVKADGLGAYSHKREKDRNRQQKIAIAREAARLVLPHDVILLDSGSTIEYMTQYLSDEDPRIILCYSLNIFEAVVPLLNSRVVLAGGVFHRDSLILNGPEAVPTLLRYRINKFFFGAGGLHPDMGITCNSEDAVPLVRDLFPGCLEKILMLDSSKFGKVTPYHLAETAEMTTIVTDDGISDQHAERIRGLGVRLIVATVEKG